MSYTHQSYLYGGPAAMPMEQPLDCGPHLAHPAMTSPIDEYFLSRPGYDISEYYQQMQMMEDYDEYAENLSRPRLTKEQVDTLEAQFQANHKPNGNVKRQLAAQTNLSLPRVANWFQNRRAKAKQQKRQEEFERMQREAKEKNDQDKPREPAASESDQSPQTHEDTESKETSTTPTQTSGTATSNEQSQPSTSVSRPKHQKTRSEVAREATFASLQRALNAAVAARENFTSESDGALQTQSELLQDVPSATSASQTNLNAALSEWGSSRDSSIAWTPSQSPENPYEFGSLNAMQFAASDGSLLINKLEDAAHQNELQGSHQPSKWDDHTKTLAEEFGLPEELYGSLNFPSVPGPRRFSTSEELANSLGSVGINPAGATSQPPTQFPGRLEGPVWRRPEKELDLAARRKRPRPAAIGTAISSRSLGGGPPSMSPTTRMGNFGGSHTLRHAKSSHTLGSRYAGVRKVSAPQRSPLGFSSFSEASLASAGSNADIKRRLQTSLPAGNLAPPTPLTPEELRHLLPATPHEGQFQLPVQRPTGGQPLSAAQAMQLSVESPPETPLTLEMIAQFQCQNIAPPLSAPPQYANFPDYVTSTSGPLTGGSWIDIPAISSPDKGSFQSNIQMPQPTYVSPITYGQDLDQSHRYSEQWPLTDDSTFYGTLKTSRTPSTTVGTNEDQKVTEFLIHEFPEQQEAHRSVAQQLPPQRPKNYTFTNATPSDF